MDAFDGANCTVPNKKKLKNAARLLTAPRRRSEGRGRGRVRATTPDGFPWLRRIQRGPDLLVHCGSAAPLRECPPRDEAVSIGVEFVHQSVTTKGAQTLFLEFAVGE